MPNNSDGPLKVNLKREFELFDRLPAFLRKLLNDAALNYGVASALKYWELSNLNGIDAQAYDLGFVEEDEAAAKLLWLKTYNPRALFRSSRRRPARVMPPQASQWADDPAQPSLFD